jgi:hypothetical protein
LSRPSIFFDCAARTGWADLLPNEKEPAHGEVSLTLFTASFAAMIHRKRPWPHSHHRQQAAADCKVACENQTKAHRPKKGEMVSENDMP